MSELHITITPNVTGRLLDFHKVELLGLSRYLQLVFVINRLDNKIVLTETLWQ